MGLRVKSRHSLLIATLLTLVVAQTSCSDPSPAAPAAQHGAADLTFARDMIPHHQQAVTLAAMVPARTGNTDLRMTATHIGADQQAEVRTLTGLLTTWDESSDSSGSSPDQHGMTMPMVGMVDDATMQRLRTLQDGPFDTLWVTSMIGHHRGAIAMANDEIAHGQSPDAIHVAELIVTSQQREISMMNHLISATE
jgi:uncharacterized protein (DUF305 family)